MAAVVASLAGGLLIEVLSAQNALRAAAWIAAAAPLAVIASLRLVHEDRAAIDRAGFRRRVATHCSRRSGRAICG